MEDSLLLNICSRMPCRPRPDALAASAPSLRPPSLLPLSAAFSRLFSRWREGKGARAPFRSPHHLIHKGCGGPTSHATATTLTHLPPLLFIHQIPMPNQTNRCPQTNASVIAQPSQPFCSALAALCPSWELHASTRLTPATPAPLSTPHVKTRHVPVASTDS